MPEAENLDKRVSEAQKGIQDSSENNVNGVGENTHISSHDPITTKHQSPLIGMVIGGVSVDSLIGAGGMSDVYHGTMKDKEVVVKVLQKLHLDNEITVRRFEEEAKATQTLEHPHIVKTVAHGKQGNVPYIVYNFIKGAQDLSKVALGMEDSSQVLFQVASALQYAHSTEKKSQVIHRDIKPGNILLQKKPLHAYVIDFGLGKIVEDTRKSVTEERDFLGTPEYASPEQATDSKDAGPKSDVYSWACTAYAIHSRRRPTEEPISTEKKSFDQTLQVIKDRMNDQKMHELWLNEAIAKSLADRISAFDDADPAQKKSIDALKKQYGAVSLKYEELIHRVLCGKKIEERPSFAMIVPRLEDMINSNMIRAREPTEKEAAAQVDMVANLDRLARERKNEVEKMGGDKEGNIEKVYMVGQTLATLADTLPVDSELREGLYKEALGHLTSVYASLDVAQRNGVSMTVVLQDADDWRSWAASGLRVVQERKRRKIENVSGQEYDALFMKANEALAAGKLVDAAECYQKIDHARVPANSKAKLQELTHSFDEIIKKLVDDGAKQLEKNIEDAETQFNSAKVLSDVLPQESEVRKLVSGYGLVVAFMKLDSQYKVAEGAHDFYQMLKYSGDMEKILGNSLYPASLHESGKQIVDKNIESVKPKKREIGLLEELMRSADELVEEKDKEVEGTSESETSIHSLSKERLSYYGSNIDSISRTFDTLKSDNIGPKYDELKTSLDFFKEDLRIENWKRGVGSDSQKERDECLKELIGHYSEKGEKSKEKLYLHLRMTYDRKRLEELGGK